MLRNRLVESELRYSVTFTACGYFVLQRLAFLLRIVDSVLVALIACCCMIYQLIYARHARPCNNVRGVITFDPKRADQRNCEMQIKLKEVADLPIYCQSSSKYPEEEHWVLRWKHIILAVHNGDNIA